MPYTKLTKDSPVMLADGAPHIYFTCENHPDLRWSAKNLTGQPDSNGDIRYNHQRNIFFVVGERECDCPASKLIGVERESE
jgi:hypothetical protein